MGTASSYQEEGGSLEFWFEFASTYSYLTAMRISDMARDAGVRVIWRPFALGPIFKSQGWATSPFSIYPAKGRYMWRDMERIAAARGLPYRKPTLFPQHTILAARTALLALETPQGERFVREVYRANFERGADLSHPETLATALAQVGLDPSLLDQAVAPANKARLIAQTTQAAELGLFGAPSFTIGSELFWGDDRLEAALAFAQTHAPTRMTAGAE